MVDFNKLNEEAAARKAIMLAIAERFRAWRFANQAKLGDAITEEAETYVALLNKVNRESSERLDWNLFLAMPEHQFLGEFSGILRHVNEDGTFRRGYRPGFAS
ncbi:hypothetical protein CPT_Sonora_067 [Stenotrophomonas phage Sonora]|nr:hypothetical protein CPT_Sonora_067 [Stenotrophomonas phage Sonora]